MVITGQKQQSVALLVIPDGDGLRRETRPLTPGCGLLDHMVRGPADTLAVRTVEHRMEDEKAILRIRRVENLATLVGEEATSISSGEGTPESFLGGADAGLISRKGLAGSLVPG